MSYYSRKHLEITLDQQRRKDARPQQSRHDVVENNQDDQQWQDEYLAAELEGDAERNCTSNWQGW